MTNFPELKAALLDWMVEATKLLADSKSTYSFADPGRWERDSDGVFRHAIRPQVIWDFQASGPFKLSHWQVVLNAIKADNRLSRQIDTFVAALAHSGHHVTANSLGWHVLPPPTENDQLVEAFEHRYAELDAFLAADEVEYLTIWPVLGLSCETLPIQLEPGLEFDNMSDRELGIALDTELIHRMFPTERVLPRGHDLHTCVRHRHKVPKVIGTTDNDESERVGVEIMSRVQEIEDALKEVFAIILSDGVGIPGRFVVIAQPQSLLSGGINWTQSAIPPALRFRRVEMTNDQAAELREVWVTLRRPRLLQRNKGLALALRRLSYQAQRERPEDELLDTMIAAEALYLSDMGKAADRGELRYRLALRAALWSQPETSGFTRREVLGVMKSAYDARSAIAHGGTPKPEDMKVRGERVSLVELARVAKAITTSGCRRAMTEASRSRATWPPDWDALALSD